MGVVGSGDLSLAEAVESHGVFDTWVPLVEPSTVRPHPSGGDALPAAL